MGGEARRVSDYLSRSPMGEEARGYQIFVTVFEAN
jgi:hypothetical protein